ncbi:MAG: NAD-dependent epimerase/dehydratase family protein [Armatimonadota bacterium]|nr:NAD-dependent epimerase/dehydratase family protein [Armatimonadota bacterium]
MSDDRRVRRAGLVGCGYIAPYHLEAIRALEGVEALGVVDTDEERACRFAAQYPGVRVYPTLEEMVTAGADVVHVLTPPRSHVPVALAAVELGCDVLVEKPLGTSVEDCERLAAAAERSGRRVAVNHSLLADPQVLRVLGWVREGRLGDVVGAEYFCSSVYPEWSGGPVPPQYGDGGYPFRDLGVHGLYLLREILGEIQDVHVTYRQHGSDPNLWFDEWRAVVECARGSGHLYLSWNVTPLQTVLTVHGTRGSARADIGLTFSTARIARPLPKAIERVWNALEDSAPVLWQVPANAGRFVAGRLRPYQGLRNFVRQFYESLATRRPLPASVDAGTKVVHWLERAARPADAAKAARLASCRGGGSARIAVTGASGFLGRRLTERLLQRGEAVRILVRRPQKCPVGSDPRVEVVVGDLGDSAAVEAAVRGAEVVYHVGAAMHGGWAEHGRGTIGGTTNVVESCLAHGVHRLVYVSSLSVLHWSALDGATGVTESAPLEPRPEARGFYTRAKLAAERLVVEAVEKRRLPAVILRPGQIVGPGVPLATLCNGISVGQWLVILGRGDVVLPLVHVDDVVTALLLAAGASRIEPGTVYHIVDGEELTQRAIVERLGGGDGPRVVYLPRAAVGALAAGFEGLGRILGREVPLTRYRVRSSRASVRFDCSKARTELGWKPTVGVRGLRQASDNDCGK